MYAKRGHKKDNKGDRIEGKRQREAEREAKKGGERQKRQANMEA